METIRRSPRLAAVALLAASTTLAAPAATRAAPPPANPDAVAVQRLTQANELLIHLAETAQHKARDPEVRRYANRARMDHGFALNRVTETAREHGIMAATPRPAAMPGPMARMKDMAQKLEQAPADRFDSQYLQAMVEVHEQLREQLAKTANRVGTPELRELIENLIPILGQHEQLARAILSDRGEAIHAASPAGR